jgi:hypothetical protein
MADAKSWIKPLAVACAVSVPMLKASTLWGDVPLGFFTGRDPSLMHAAREHHGVLGYWTGQTQDVRDGWGGLLNSVRSHLESGHHADFDTEGEPPSLAAIVAVDRLISRALPYMSFPDVWGADDEGGIYIEQHEKHSVTAVRVARSGRAELLVFRERQLAHAIEV